MRGIEYRTYRTVQVRIIIEIKTVGIKKQYRKGTAFYLAERAGYRRYASGYSPMARKAHIQALRLSCSHPHSAKKKNTRTGCLFLGGEGGITPLSLRGVRAMRIMLSVLPKLCARLSEPMTPSWFLPALRRYKNEPPQKGRPVFLWRRGRDSNPRYVLAYARFPSVCLRPLNHLSTVRAFYAQLVVAY